MCRPKIQLSIWQLGKPYCAFSEAKNWTDRSHWECESGNKHFVSLIRFNSTVNTIRSFAKGVFRQRSVSKIEMKLQFPYVVPAQYEHRTYSFTKPLCIRKRVILPLMLLTAGVMRQHAKGRGGEINRRMLRPTYIEWKCIFTFWIIFCSSIFLNETMYLSLYVCSQISWFG